MTYSAWVIPPRPPGDLLTQLVVTDDAQNGRAVASGDVAFGTGNVATWDASLVRAGFARTSAWLCADEGRAYVCTCVTDR
ncbi:hypothetical protein CLV30_1263 [Haloactinopolyspora alba]|uniref:Uncharacterized protein n=1 Tax=Haloactinopolyspora alba TaxID=648780 RepID=A0A2P8DGI7_9ACTN|nr:hypothetical protein [Haloactinopolyspora alba]PSK96344.1 hypothetical protein CLV30_1263 [Haloactinopolyspora alba]